MAGGYRVKAMNGPGVVGVWLMLLATWLGGIATPLCAEGEEPIGNVVFVRGEVQVLREGQPLVVARRDALYRDDLITTGPQSRFSAKLLDGSVITLGERADIAIHRFEYLPKARQGTALFAVTKGAFRVLTGDIQQMIQPRYQVVTPVATIGVRGTDFWGGFIFGEQLDVTVLSGKGVDVVNATGQVLVTPGMGTTVAMTAATAMPRPPKQWPQSKLDQAVASVALTP